MEILLNILLIMIGTVSLVCGISFFYRERNIGQTRAYVLGYSIGATLWCYAYGLIGICSNCEVAEKIRIFGVLGINILMVTDFFMATAFSGIKSCWRCISRIVMIFLGVMDMFIYTSPRVDTFVQIGNWTTWYGNSCWNRTYHSVYLVILVVVLFLNAILWVMRENVKRRRKFMWMMIIANFVILFACIPDTIFVLRGMKALPTSGFGGALCAIMIWYGAVKLNAFDIAIDNAIDIIYDNVNVGIMLYDTDYKLVHANPYARRLLKMTESMLNTKSMSCIFNTSDEICREHFENALKSGDDTIQLGSKDEEVSCSVNTTVALDSYNEPYCYVSAVYDMTAMKNIMEELKAANLAKSNFLASMSHEIRTPINAVLGLDEMILREAKDKEILGYAADIQGAGRSLLSIINDILDFSKIESGKMDIIPTNYHLSSLINDSYNMIATRAKEKGLEVEIVNNEALPNTLYGDEIRVRQIIINLMSNAIKYTSEGKVTLFIDEDDRDEEKLRLIIKVKDTGIGIKEENISKLFDSFKRVDEVKNRNIEGTGLGLAITKQLVDKMNGSIYVESTYGEGSTFTVVIPQHIVDKKPVGNIYRMYAGNATIGEKYKEKFQAPDARILVVDDVKMNLAVFMGLLKNTKMQIDTALSGMESLLKIKETKYDIIFMDHMMPKMDGIETLQALRKDKSHKNQDTPVIVLTANAIVGVDEMYREKGFADYLSKPVQSEKLEEMVMKYLDKEKVIETYHEKEKKDVSDEKNETELLEKLDFINTASALEYCMGDIDFYREVLNTYVNEDREEALQEAFDDENLDEYRIKIHALKSTSLNIGADELSEEAKTLEEACKSKDLSYIRENHERVMQMYAELLVKIKNVL